MCSAHTAAHSHATYIYKLFESVGSFSRRRVTNLCVKSSFIPFEFVAFFFCNVKTFAEWVCLCVAVVFIASLFISYEFCASNSIKGILHIRNIKLNIKYWLISISKWWMNWAHTVAAIYFSIASIFVHWYIISDVYKHTNELCRMKRWTENENKLQTCSNKDLTMYHLNGIEWRRQRQRQRRRGVKKNRPREATALTYTKKQWKPFGSSAKLRYNE